MREENPSLSSTLEPLYCSSLATALEGIVLQILLVRSCLATRLLANRYPRLVTKVFQLLMGKNMEVYIDDMLVKSKERPNHTKHLQETFELLLMNGMKLNPLKCAFGVSLGKFLGVMVTKRRIEANPIQLRAIMESQTPTSRKGVQQLIGQLAVLGRFISCFTNRLKPFFTTLKGGKQTRWNIECD